jgi:ABC-type cobalamin/Fe3+-siderophores transport system ATPase subunit
MSKLEQKLTAVNVGPVERLEISFPTDGGVTVLRGRNGSGKSTLLDAASAVVGDRKLDASVRDGKLKGEIAGFGARITLGKVNRRSGVAEVETLEDRLDISALVDPGMKDVEAADARRIKALVNLSGTKADAAAFRSIASADDFAECVDAKSTATDDMVEMAARIKRDFERVARYEEGQAEKEAAAAKAIADEVGHVAEPPMDADAAKQQHLAAVGEFFRLNNQRKNAEESSASAHYCRAKIAEAEAQSVSLEKIKSQVDYCQSRVEVIDNEIADLEGLLAGLRESRMGAARDLADATTELSAAEDRAKLIDQWRQTVAHAEVCECPTDEELQAAEKAMESAAGAIVACEMADKAKARLKDADNHNMRAAMSTGKAQRLRKAAAAADSVLSEIVACESLCVEDGRLVTDTARGATYFADLSEGERWKIAIDLAADRVGEGGLIVIPQVAFESLDPTNREAIAEHARRRRVNILTAEAADGELRAEAYEAEHAGEAVGV